MEHATLFGIGPQEKECCLEGGKLVPTSFIHLSVLRSHSYSEVARYMLTSRVVRSSCTDTCMRPTQPADHFISNK